MTGPESLSINWQTLSFSLMSSDFRAMIEFNAWYGLTAEEEIKAKVYDTIRNNKQKKQKTNIKKMRTNILSSALRI